MSTPEGSALLSTDTIDARFAGRDARGLIDRHTGTKIGSYCRTRRFSGPLELLDASDSSVVLRLVKTTASLGGCTVVDPGDVVIGHIVPSARTNWLGRTVPIGYERPMKWMGWINLGDSDDGVAFVREGAIVLASERKLVAELSLRRYGRWGHGSSGLWTLQMGDAARGPLRLMALAWLGFAWRMQRSSESGE